MLLYLIKAYMYVPAVQVRSIEYLTRYPDKMKFSEMLHIKA